MSPKASAASEKQVRRERIKWVTLGVLCSLGMILGVAIALGISRYEMKWWSFVVGPVALLVGGACCLAVVSRAAWIDSSDTARANRCMA